uniref:Uncharacterized protein n=1 Tax=Anguilla anguilla TaxID=7936 RepID=A0A0E9RSC2_ANGAN
MNLNGIINLSKMMDVHAPTVFEPEASCRGMAFSKRGTDHSGPRSTG